MAPTLKLCGLLDKLGSGFAKMGDSVFSQVGVLANKPPWLYKSSFASKKLNITVFFSPVEFFMSQNPQLLIQNKALSH